MDKYWQPLFVIIHQYSDLNDGCDLSHRFVWMYLPIFTLNVMLVWLMDVFKVSLKAIAVIPVELPSFPLWSNVMSQTLL